MNLALVGVEESSFTEAGRDRLHGLAESVIPVGDVASVPDEAGGLIGALGLTVTRADIDRLQRVRYIGVRGSAYSRVDVAAAAERGVVVTTTAGYSTTAVAEFAVGAAISHLRELGRARRQADEGNYSEESFAGRELGGLRIGVVGLGRIGFAIANLVAGGFGADVAYWTRSAKPEAEQRGLKRMDLVELFGWADVVFVCLALNAQTKGLVGGGELQHAGGKLIVNVAPMELFDFDALVDILNEQRAFLILDHSDELDPAYIERLRAHQPGHAVPTDCVHHRGCDGAKRADTARQPRKLHRRKAPEHRRLTVRLDRALVH